jgi:hypothetical protein
MARLSIAVAEGERGEIGVVDGAKPAVTPDGRPLTR